MNIDLSALLDDNVKVLISLAGVLITIVKIRNYISFLRKKQELKLDLEIYDLIKKVI